MKRLFVSLCIVFSLLFSSKCMAQNWSNYLQFEGGLGLSYNGIDGCFLQGEYGKTYKWLDLGLSSAYESLYQKTYHLHYRYSTDIQATLDSYAIGTFNIMFNARFDFIKLFKQNSRDSFKIGGSFGYRTDFEGLEPIGTIGLSYDYRITPDISVGTFYKYNFIEMGVAGISVRRNF